MDLVRAFLESNCSLITGLGLLFKVFLVTTAHSICQVTVLAMTSCPVSSQGHLGSCCVLGRSTQPLRWSRCGADLQQLLVGWSRGGDGSRVILMQGPMS